MTNSTDALNKQLFQELDDKAAENCNGGKREVFTLRNWANGSRIAYSVDGKSDRLRYGQGMIWTAFRGGVVRFDRDTRAGHKDMVQYNLKGGAVYAFRWNKGTKGNPFDVYLNRIG